ncbi:MAG: TonB C-terminal domain-containing protein [Bacteriovoracaceae bacterium]|nr:TonB C-terminal domain-containing protein [Bacteriovoracaceae bacterium]
MIAFTKFFTIDPDAKQALIKSVLLHIIILAAFSILSYVSKRELENRNKEFSKMLASRVVRVDLVAMPKYTLKELKTFSTYKRPAKKLAKVTASKAKDTSKGPKFLIKKKRKKKRNFLKMLKAIGRKKIKVNKKGAKKASAENVLHKEFKQLILAGNKLKKGKALYGDNINNTKEATLFTEYGQKSIRDLLRPFWRLPSYLKSQDLKCRIRLYLDGAGKLLKVEVIESSGSEEYDGIALNTIKRASPFPRVPKKIAYRLLRGDMIMGFPL